MRTFITSLLLAAMTIGTAGHADARAAREPVASAIASANERARVGQASARFEGARTIYAFESGALFQVYTAPGFVSTILLEPGEQLNNIAAGDTSRWLVTEAQGGADGQARPIVLIKPQTLGLRTNLVLITDRRTYLIEAIAEARTFYSAEIAWSYPQASTRVEATTPGEAINFDYRVRTVRGARPAWFPAHVFDDGARTWIEFPPNVQSTELPPLFVITADGAELVNYRVQGGRYMLDRVFDVAELRLGTHAQTIVRLERNPVAPQPVRSMHRRVHP
ncbi:MAG: TrbG/VirB9 family P-type conjugative transfer protein [Terricaulis sp.]